MTTKARIHEIADGLALHFGGNHVPINQDGEYWDHYALVEVPMPAPSLPYVLTLSRRGYGADAGKVTVTLSAPKYSGERVEDRIAWPSARVHEDRDIASIAADVGRRVVNTELAQAALRAHKERLDARDAAKAGVDGAMAELMTNSRATESQNYPRTAHGGHLFGSAPGVYFTARVAPTSVHFDRIGSVSIDQAKRIIAILEEG